IDTSKAEALPGVRAVLTGADVGELRTGRNIKDVPILCTDRVRFVGDRVAVVVAEDRDTAEAAVQLVEVEYEEVPAVFDADEAMALGAPVIHPEARSYVGF